MIPAGSTATFSSIPVTMRGPCRAVVLTITDTTPATINAILADPRADHDTATSTVRDTPADVSRTALAR
jgi:hypothetical protein